LKSPFAHLFGVNAARSFFSFFIVRLSSSSKHLCSQTLTQKSKIQQLFLVQLLMANLKWQLMDGILIIDKPAGMTSHDVVNRVRKILKEKRIGHTGTLDPFATGVLVLMVGRATRLAQFLNSDVKEYEATMRFGFATDTGDLTGSPKIADCRLPIADWFFNKEEIENRKSKIENALASLRGEILQVPPMYSAKKVQGKKLYELAREGKEIERKAVSVVVYEFEAVDKDGKLLIENEDGTIDMNVRVKCSAGTYIRVLAESLGKMLGTEAHLASLRRIKAGEFGIERAMSLEKLEELAEKGNVSAALLPMKAALSKLDSLHLTPADAKRISNGVALKVGNVYLKKGWREGEAVALFDESDELVAIALYKDDAKSLKPSVVLVR
jgi:tRNA pseudouridine55 synthase